MTLFKSIGSLKFLHRPPIIPLIMGGENIRVSNLELRFMEEKKWNTAFFLTPFNSKIKNVDSEAIYFK